MLGDVKIIGFIVSFALFVGGIYMLAVAFSVPGYESVMFIGGILVSSIGIMIPIHLLKRIDA
jgi:hypothetical protein